MCTIRAACFGMWRSAAKTLFRTHERQSHTARRRPLGRHAERGGSGLSNGPEVDCPLGFGEALPRTLAPCKPRTGRLQGPFDGTAWDVPALPGSGIEAQARSEERPESCVVVP